MCCGIKVLVKFHRNLLMIRKAFVGGGCRGIDTNKKKIYNEEYDR